MTFWAGLRWGLMRLVDPVEFLGPIECLGWLGILPAVVTLNIPTRFELCLCGSTLLGWILLLFQFLPRCESAFYRLIPWNLEAGVQPFVSCQQLLVRPFSSFSSFKVLACLLFSSLYLFKFTFAFSPLICHFNEIWVQMELNSRVHLPWFPKDSNIYFVNHKEMK